MSERPNQIYAGLVSRLVAPPALAWALTSSDGLMVWILNRDLDSVPFYRQNFTHASYRLGNVWALVYALENADVIAAHTIKGMDALRNIEMPSTTKKRIYATAILCGTTVGAWYAGARTLLEGNHTHGLANVGLGCMLASVALLVWQ